MTVPGEQCARAIRAFATLSCSPATTGTMQDASRVDGMSTSIGAVHVFRMQTHLNDSLVETLQFVGS